MENPKNITLRIISPERVIYQGAINHIVLPAADGEIGIFQHHSPYMTYLKPGTLQIFMPDGRVLPLDISSGLVEFKEDRLTILTRDRIDAHECLSAG
ncbi:MAG: ATP synthase F1 subunit epsilon [bacterium]